MNETVATYGVAGWTLFSRVTGLLRVAVAGAILGPTFFANIFQATNTVPNLTYNLMAGSVLTTLIIPLLVGALDRDGHDAAKQLLRQLVGVVIAGCAAAAAAVLLCSPVIVKLLTLGVHGHADAADARNQCWVLLFLVIPQIGLYGIVAVATAAQNARNHFALAAAAPALENIGLITTLVLAAKIFGRDTHHVSSAYLLFLGSGATLAVVEVYPYVPYIQFLLPGVIVLAVFISAMIGGGRRGSGPTRRCTRCTSASFRQSAPPHSTQAGSSC